jgi:hypothetical protein
MEKTRLYVKIILITKKRSLTPIFALRFLRGSIDRKKADTENTVCFHLQDQVRDALCGCDVDVFFVVSYAVDSDEYWTKGEQTEKTRKQYVRQ